MNLKPSAIQITNLLRDAIAGTIEQIWAIESRNFAIVIKPCFLKYEAHYSSSVAFSVAAYLKQDVSEIASILCHALQAFQSKKWTVSVGVLGTLNFVLEDIWLAELLVEISNWTISTAISDSGKNAKLVNTLIKFKGYTHVQYVHARCCALLRLAVREHLLNVESENITNHRLLSQSQNLLLREPVEMQLILYMIAIADDLVNSQLTTQQRIKWALQLVTAFKVFYSQCRLFGVERSLALARISLIAIIPKLLNGLVGELIPLPSEL